MPDYFIAYHGGLKFGSPEEGARHMEKWKAWMGRIGDAMINPGAPLRNSRTVGSGGVSDGPNPLSGYSILKAASMDAALQMAKDCPHLDIGTVEVAEVMQMQMK